MAEQPLVSVVTIFLNEERFLGEAVESVVAQTYGNWELLLVDDGSTDSSTAMATWYAQRLPQKVRYLEHEGHRNHGMSASRNLGIRHAAGSCIAFLDADDVWLPHTLERQVSTLLSNPRAGMVYGSTQMWFSWTGQSGDLKRDFTRRLGVAPNTLFEPPTLLRLFLQNRARPPATCSVLIRRAAVEQVGGFEERFRGLHEDQAFFSKVCSKVPVFVAGEWWGRYRQHPRSSCSLAARAGRTELEQTRYLQWLEKYVSRERVSDREIRRFLRAATWPANHPTLYRLLRRSHERSRRVRELTRSVMSRPSWPARELALVPPRALMIKDGFETLEDWLRAGETWGMLLRLYGGLRPDSAVLELGCGSGRSAYALRRILSLEGHYQGFDPSRQNVRFLAERFRERYPNFEFTWTDGAEPRPLRSGGVTPATSRFPRADGSCDIVYAPTQFMRLCPEGATNALRESARVLRPGGRCLLGLFLLDQGRSGRPRPWGYVDAAFDFVGEAKDDDFVAVERKGGWRMTAYRLRLIERLATQARLVLARPPIPGAWSGSTPAWADEHDLVVLEKPSVVPPNRS